ncbi:MAG: hypothetical protein U9N45_06250, partial [Gemmatimonadota bacterium]|nr:hypothetical protein [Gemmatimonadota bacterium]
GAKDLLGAVHPHPAFSEALMEAVGDAAGAAIHL